MPTCCSVFNCKGNYKSEEGVVSTFSLPKDEKLRKKWLRNIPTDFSKLKKPVVCEKHFSPDSIIRTEQFIVDGEIKVFQRSYPKLKPDAVPTIFPGLHERFSTAVSSCKRLKDVEEDNFNAGIAESLQAYKEYEERNTVHNLQDIVVYFATIKEELQGHWICIESEDKLVMCLIDVSVDIPCVIGSVGIGNDLCVNRLSVNNILVSEDTLPNHISIVKKNTILEELLKYINSLVQDKSANEGVLVNSIEKSLLNTFTSENYPQLPFLIKQIKFLVVQENNRRYSGNTSILAASVYVHSSSVYHALYKSCCMFLPHPRNLRKLVGKFDLNSFDMDGSIDYLKVKKEYLQQHELIVNILLDEVYINPHVTFKGGTLYGMCNSRENSNQEQIAKTAQVFMISSVFSQYKDVVSIVPVNNLKADQLQKMLLHIIDKVESIGFVVLSLVSDNNQVNRRAFELLTANKILQPSIDHPKDKNRKLFLIFDTVHILKSIRNIWISKEDKCLMFPNLNNFDVIEKANFKYLEFLYKKEKDSLVKYGHLLSYKVLYPSNIQKQNVKLALMVFDERNIAALKCMAAKDNDFIDCEPTTSFMQIICNWWHIVNCKSAFEGARFNCKFREPIRVNSVMQIDFLKRMSLWLKNWRQSVPSFQSLTPQTFQSLINTIDAFLLLIPYLFNMYNVDYVLLSKFQSDNLESRFSSYRQLSGANYYISYMQLLEAERKLRFSDTLSLFSINQNVPLKTLLPCSEHLDNSVCIEKYEGVLEGDFNFNDIDASVMSVLVYITGYGVKKELFSKKCDECASWVESDKEIEISVPNDFLIEYDKGKLTVPTVNSAIVTGVAWYLLQRILFSHQGVFMTDFNQFSILFKLCCLKLGSCSFENLNLSNCCKCNRTARSLLQNICSRSCKVLINNLTKQKNDCLENNKCNRQLKKLKRT